VATYFTERVLEVRHWSERLFSFSTTRNSGLRFENGQFLMLGLAGTDGKKITRAYSIASANYEEHLAFYSIKVPNGPLTSRLQHIKPGSPLLVSAKPTGTLVLRDLNPGKRLFLLATGTGVAPFMSIIKDPETYETFDQVFLVRGASRLDGHGYADSVLESLRLDPYLGDIVSRQLLDYSTVTREPYRHQGRITALIESGVLFSQLGIAPLNPARDRVMACGNMQMIGDVVKLLDARGFAASARTGVAGDYVIERAFVESFAASKQPRALEASMLG
jgi:ferredoxin/flavodoxin---NADP+ reductase